MAITGIILAGGKSNRMGFEKGLLPWKSKPMVEWVLAALQPHCDRILISANNTAGYHFLKQEIVKDHYKNIGPMGGLHAGLSGSETEHNIVVACDMPLVDAEIIEMLIGNAASYQVVAPEIDENILPVCAYYHRSVLEVLNREIESGLFKTRLFLEKLRVKTISISDETIKLKLLNVNTPYDLNRLKAL